MRPEKQTLASTQAKERALLTLIIPTRNEARNIPTLVGELKEVLSGVDYRVVFVDDSTDETPKVVRTLSEEDGRIVLIHRKEAEQSGGLSTAVTTGMDATTNGSEYTCVMDADLQHPQRKAREMLEEAQVSGADVVVASRYARGLVLRTSQPTLVLTGPRRLPLARTNARWASSLAVPVLDGEHSIGLIYATRNSTEQFTEEDLHWLTAYASTSGPIFYTN